MIYRNILVRFRQNRIVLCWCLTVFLFSLSLSVSAQNKETHHRIDSHIHIYDTEREGSSVFLNKSKHQKIYYPHLEKEFLEVASPAGVNYAIVVEASKGREDNFWAMKEVNESPNLLAFIANLNPQDSTFTTDLVELSKHKKFRGIRIRPKKKVDLSDQHFIDKLGELAIRDLVLELGPSQGPIEAIEKIAQTYPTMSIIMNHMAGGRIENGKITPDSWDGRLKRLAALPNVYCKVSALYTLSGLSLAASDHRYYESFIQKVLDAFGSDRILFGSNWTLSEMHGTYSDLVEIFNGYLEGHREITEEQLFLKNTLCAYGLDMSCLVCE